MSVLLLGATGFIGPYLVEALASRGDEVIAVSRAGGGRRGVAADRRDVRAIKALARDRAVTTVVDLLAYTEGDTLPLLAALDGEVERWVMASSCDVYRNYEGLHRKTRVEPILEPLTEASPLRGTRHPYRATPRRAPGAPDAWMDDYDKLPLEAALRARPGLAGTILRLPMVFGPGDRQRRFRWAVAPMAAGVAELRLDREWAAWLTTYGYVADVADAIANAALHRQAAGRTFNLGSPSVDHATWVERFAAVMGWRGEVVDAPRAPGGPLAGLDLSFPLVVDTRAFREACAWREPTALEEALGRTVRDEVARGRSATE